MMLDRDAPIFRNIPQALHVSHLIAAMPVTSKCSTQTLIDRLKEQAGIPRETFLGGTINFGGLDSMAVRAQCAMVLAAVQDHCMAYERAAITAWFTAAGNDDKTLAGCTAYKRKAWAITALHGYVQSQLSVQSPHAQKLMVWHVHSTGALHKQVTERAIAAEHDLSQSTVHRDIVKISAMAKALRQNGMRRLASMFERDGLVESAEECAA